MGRKVHLINKEGNSLVVERRDFMDSQLNDDNKYSDYEVDIDWYLKNYKMPPMVFTPDGDFPLVNVEKGRAAIRVFAPLPEDMQSML